MRKISSFALAAMFALPALADVSPPRPGFGSHSLGVSRPIDSHRGAVRAIRFSSDGKTYATLGQDQTLKLWSTGSDKPAAAIAGTFRPESLWLSGDARTIIAQEGQNIVAIDAASQERGTPIQNVMGRGFAVSPDGKRVVTMTRVANVTVYDAKDGTEIVTLQGPRRVPRSLAWTSDGSRIIEFGHDGLGRVWDAEKGEELFQIEGTAKVVYDLQVSPDGKLIGFVGNDGTTRLCDATTGKEVRTCNATKDHRALAFTRDGKYFVTGHQDGMIRLWDRKTGREIRKSEGHPAGGVRTLAFTPDGRTLVSGGNDGKVLIWGRGAVAPTPGNWAPKRSGKPGFLGITGGAGPAGKGVSVASVVEDSAASSAGLQIGDVIVTFAGKEISTFEELRALVNGMEEGDEVEFVFTRDGEQDKRKVKLGGRLSE